MHRTQMHKHENSRVVYGDAECAVLTTKTAKKEEKQSLRGEEEGAHREFTHAALRTHTHEMNEQRQI